MTASVIIACHDERRWDSILAAIDTTSGQDPAPTQVILAVDHNSALYERLRREVAGIELVQQSGESGASAARNAGAQVATADVLVFIDDDVLTTSGWLRALLEPFADATVIGTGGRTVARWLGPRPRWFPDEFGWVVGASFAGMPTAKSEVRNVWSGNMAVRREAFDAVGGFRTGFGKVGGASRPEDTDFSIRVAVAHPAHRWLYVPEAVVEHEVPIQRTSFGFFLRRCYAEGIGKIELSAQLGADQDLRNADGELAPAAPLRRLSSDRHLDEERRYLRRTVPLGFLGALRGREPARAGAILAGVVAAAGGGVVGVARLGSRR